MLLQKSEIFKVDFNISRNIELRAKSNLSSS